MGKYRALSPVKTADGKVHKPNEVLELTEQEAKNCLSFKAVVPVSEASQPVQPVVTPILEKTAAQSQPEPATSQETVATPMEVLPPESDVR